MEKMNITTEKSIQNYVIGVKVSYTFKVNFTRLPLVINSLLVLLWGLAFSLVIFSFY